MVGPQSLTAEAPMALPAGGRAARPRPILFWLRGLVIACLLPAWAAAALLITESYQRQRAALEAGALVTARTLAQGLDRDLTGMLGALQVLSFSEPLARGDLVRLHAQATRVAAEYDWDRLMLLDLEGRALLDTQQPADAPVASEADPALVRRAVAGGRPVITDLNAGSSASSAFVEVPVLIDGRPVAVLAAALSFERLEQILRRQRLPEGWVSTIVDRTGTVVARSRAGARFVGGKAPAPLREQLAAMPEATVLADLLDGGKAYAAFTRSALSGWSVVVGIDEASLIGELRRSLGASVAVAGLMLLAGLLAAGAIARRIAGAIEALRPSAMALAAGAPLPATRTVIAEVDAIAADLGRAAQRLARAREDRERAEAAAQQVEIGRRVALRWRSLLEASPNATLVIDREGRLRFANARVATLFGWDPEALAERGFAALLPERVVAEHGGLVRRFFADPKVRLVAEGRELTGRRADGSEFPIEISLSPLEIDGEPLVIAAIRDLTRRKRQDAELERTRARMAASARLSALGGMAGGVAHEINNPLAVIHATAADLAELAAEGAATPDEVTAGAARIVTYAERITKIVVSLRALGRDGSADPFAEASVADIVAHALDVGAERFRLRGVALETPAVAPGLGLRCREVQIAQVLLNLLQNAFDAVVSLPDPRWVRLAIETDADQIVFAVSDSGPGVPPELRARVMEPFFTTKPVGQGTGLGLSLSRRIAEDHGGRLVIADTAAGHSCVRLEIPRVREDAS